ncbi:hypothetical protein EDD70_2165 [Hydrogenoanaerobacterium saccharovorans]|uniref:Uncharacterized protein n=1 Tax=Hydrogenoanaerobacterium saccharovorans TaxID=474960 RepID=A0A1H8CM35_9FIRM|nr:hypothetical protein [Hydrogenoanaerobacterium saccharovorans]RPF43204.1 hypothetical protein EDD70_2165 [Hydrogenoanaerobacterium saccharovorans]SEM96095.1 hypothetical protein SAMN05216180_2223 [Hydrogenoanaerobacterium saccharovorans]
MFYHRLKDLREDTSLGLTLYIFNKENVKKSLQYLKKCYTTNVKTILHLQGVFDMKNLFKKADEMEMAIYFKSMKISWVFLVLTLSIWEVVELARGNHESPVILLVALQGAIFWFSKLYFTHKITKEEKHHEE